jgi:modulator of FtsH protease
MQPIQQTRSASAIGTNVILRKTYALLGATLVFSGLVAYWAMVTNAPPLNFLFIIVGYFGCIMLASAMKNSAMGIIPVFALTGFMGYTLGPILNLYLHTYINGGQIVATALGSTGVVFFVLSAYAVITKKDFSYLSGFLMVAITAAFLLGLANIFLHLQALSFVVSGAFILLSSALILFQTSMIVNGGETSYIMATITLYVSIYNLFISLLSILGMTSGRN